MFSLFDYGRAIGFSTNSVEPVTLVTSDSRKVIPGTLFFALTGTGRDGHDHVGEAFQKGAIAAVVEKEVPFKNTFRVFTSRQAYAVACGLYFQGSTEQLDIYGVTGTNGKTTTTYLWKQAFEALGVKPGVIGTLGVWKGNHHEEGSLTTPDSFDLHKTFFEMKKENVTACGIEVSSIALDQYRTYGIPFRVAAFTNFTQDHLDYHGSMENYFFAKEKFFTDYLIDRAVIEIDTDWGQRLWKICKAKEKISYGFSPKADYQLFPNGSLRTPLQKHARLDSPLFGSFNALNLLGVLASFPTEHEDLLLNAFKTFHAAPGRLERVSLPENRPFVFVDYAHTPDALENVLKTLSEIKKGKIITVFGCGGNRDKLKRPLMAEIASRFSDIVVITSDNPRLEDPTSIIEEIAAGIPSEKQFQKEVDRKKAIASALAIAKQNDIVLIAGKGHENYQIIGNEKHPFDDKEVVLKYYQHAS